MIDEDLVRTIEALVLVSQEPVRTELLAQFLEVSAVEVDAVCGQLSRTYEEAGHGFQLVKVAGGWRYQTHPDQSPIVERFVLEGQRARLSGAALETLAIIAYKQPISRMQVAAIRGVDPDAVMRTLHGRALIAPIGRDPGPGQAVMWGTTPLFLEKLGLAAIDDLPPLASFVPDPEIVEALERTLRSSAAEAGISGELAGAPHGDDGAQDAASIPEFGEQWAVDGGDGGTEPPSGGR